MRRRHVVYGPTAQDDLLKIARHLAHHASAGVAQRFVSRIRRNISALEYAAERGTIRDEVRQIRVIGILPTVAIAFSVEENAVTVHRILHNGRNWTAD